MRETGFNRDGWMYNQWGQETKKFDGVTLAGRLKEIM